MKNFTLLFLSLLLFSMKGNCQAISGYLFTESTEIYVPVNGINANATGDDGTDNNNDIGFPFNFGGIFYSTFSISTNGFIRLGNDIGGNNWTNVLANNAAQTPLIAAFWDDHNRNNGSIQYAVAGSAPFRTLEVGWNTINISNGGVASGGVSASFKMRMYETTGQIDFIYGTQMISAGAITASIGLNDTTSFISISPAAAGATSSFLVADNGISSTANIIGKKYSFLPQPQCSGTPNPGNTITSATSVCPNEPFTLSTENTSNEFGYSYQWQSSTDGNTWTNIAGALNSTLTTSQSVITYYRYIVTCAGSFVFSIPVQITTDAAICYCFPTYDFGKTDGDLISNVVIAGTTLFNNTGADPVNPSYTYFTGQPNYTAILQAGNNYEISVSVGTYGQQQVAVWIDYNDDYTFTIDERVGFTETAIESNDTGIFTISLACTPPAGIHRMRVRDVYNVAGSFITPCDNYGYGETEDYDIEIAPADACPVPSGLDVTNMTPSGGIFTWNTGCDQTSWDVYITIGGGPAPTIASVSNVTSPFFLTGLNSYTTYDVYVMGYCGVNGSSVWAGPFSFMTAPLAVPNDECETAFALVAGGTFDEFPLTATNVGATKTIGPANPTCASFAFSGDVWFSVVVPADGNITLETQSDSGSEVIDTGLNAFTGDCGSLVPIGCSDDEGIDAFSRLNLTGLLPGSTIYARVWEYANDTFGTFRVSAWNSTLGTNSSDTTDFRYFPNPVKDELNIEHEQNISNVSVYNLLGQVISVYKLDNKSAQINTSMLAPGTYIVKVTSGEQVQTIKILKD